jgi:hypothetical protein
VNRVTAATLLAALLVVPAWLSPARAAEGTVVSFTGGTLAGKLSGETRVSGEVRVTDDVTVLPGAKLVAAPGTVIVFEKTDSTKVDPEYFHGGTELVVRGELRAEGARFRFEGRSGGIVVAGGRARFSGGEISGAEAGLTVLRGGEAVLGKGFSVRDCRIALALFAGGRLETEGADPARATGNGVALVRFPGAHPAPAGIAFERSEEADVVAWGAAASPPRDVRPLATPAPPPGAQRMGDTFLDADRTLSGDIVVDGTIRVSPGVNLTLAPGTRLFFTFRDTDGDGIGENGLFLQGNLVARGTHDRRIGFFPAAGGDGRGLWDSVNFMASDQGGNVLEHVDVAGGYRGLHAHFSKLSGVDVRIADCFRGMQFQESEVSLSGVSVRDSYSVLRGRDSTVRLSGLSVADVVSGVNLFRSQATIERFDMAEPGFYGARLRDSRVSVEGGLIARSFVPLSVQEGNARIRGVSAVEPGLAGFSLMEGDVTMEGCRSTGSRVDGISAVKAKVTWSDGEISGYGRDAVHLSGPADVVLKGTRPIAPEGAKKIPVHDGKVVPGLGIVRFE